MALTAASHMTFLALNSEMVCFYLISSENVLRVVSLNIINKTNCKRKMREMTNWYPTSWLPALFYSSEWVNIQMPLFEKADELTTENALVLMIPVIISCLERDWLLFVLIVTHSKYVIYALSSLNMYIHRGHIWF